MYFFQSICSWVYLITILPPWNLLSSLVDINIQQHITKPFAGTKFTLRLTAYLSTITAKNISGGMIKTPENKELINQYLFDHNTMSLLLWSRCLLLEENQLIFLISGLLLGICGYNIESPQVDFFCFFH